MDTIALIAHDGKKDEMLAFANENRDILRQFRLIATASTGKMLIEKVGLQVELYAHGPDGGDVMVAAEVIQRRVAMVFFFVEPRDVHPHDPDIRTLLRVCNLLDLPLATNPATGQMLLRGWSAVAN